MIAGTLDVQSNVYNSIGSVTFNDNVTINSGFALSVDLIYSLGSPSWQITNSTMISGGYVACASGSQFRVGATQGVTGSFVDNGGNTVTVTGGIITALT